MLRARLKRDVQRAVRRKLIIAVILTACLTAAPFVAMGCDGARAQGQYVTADDLGAIIADAVSLAVAEALAGIEVRDGIDGRDGQDGKDGVVDYSRVAAASTVDDLSARVAALEREQLIIDVRNDNRNETTVTNVIEVTIDAGQTNSQDQGQEQASEQGQGGDGR